MGLELRRASERFSLSIKEEFWCISKIFVLMGFQRTNHRATAKAATSSCFNFFFSKKKFFCKIYHGWSHWTKLKSIVFKFFFYNICIDRFQTKPSIEQQQQNVAASTSFFLNLFFSFSSPPPLQQQKQQQQVTPSTFFFSPFIL